MRGNGLDFYTLTKVPEHVTALRGIDNSWLVASKVLISQVRHGQSYCKGEDRCSLENWWPITVGNIEIWLFGEVLAKKLQASIDIRSHQARLMVDRGTYDHLFT